jgi:hypothetical protein
MTNATFFPPYRHAEPVETGPNDVVDRFDIVPNDAGWGALYLIQQYDAFDDAPGPFSWRLPHKNAALVRKDGRAYRYDNGTLGYPDGTFVTFWQHDVASLDLTIYGFDTQVRERIDDGPNGGHFGEWTPVRVVLRASHKETPPWTGN